jgi:hypothetical protein
MIFTVGSVYEVKSVFFVNTLFVNTLYDSINKNGITLEPVSYRDYKSFWTPGNKFLCLGVDRASHRKTIVKILRMDNSKLIHMMFYEENDYTVCVDRVC